MPAPGCRGAPQNSKKIVPGSKAGSAERFCTAAEQHYTSVEEYNFLEQMNVGVGDLESILTSGNASPQKPTLGLRQDFHEVANRLQLECPGRELVAFLNARNLAPPFLPLQGTSSSQLYS